MVQVLAAKSLQDCIDTYGGIWEEIISPPFIGWGEDRNYIPFPNIEPAECILSKWDNFTKNWLIIK